MCPATTVAAAAGAASVSVAESSGGAGPKSADFVVGSADYVVGSGEAVSPSATANDLQPSSKKLACVSLATTTNCGRCGNRCISGQICNNYACTSAAPGKAKSTQSPFSSDLG